MQITKTILLIVLIITISACTIKPDVSKRIQVNQSATSIENWKINGKIAFISAQERRSAYLAWHQQNRKFDMVLTTLVGSTIADLTYDGKLATIEVDNQALEDTSPERLLSQVTGWNIPVNSLPTWITGSSLQGDKIVRYDNGLVKVLYPDCSDCDSWIINYERYADFTITNDRVLTLPSRIKLQNANLQVIIRIDDWRES